MNEELKALSVKELHEAINRAHWCYSSHKHLPLQSGIDALYELMRRASLADSLAALQEAMEWFGNQAWFMDRAEDRIEWGVEGENDDEFSAFACDRINEDEPLATFIVRAHAAYRLACRADALEVLPSSEEPAT